MGNLTVIQGAALRDSYSALVLGRGLLQTPALSVASPVGTGGASFRLERAVVSPRLKVQLEARRLQPFYLRATGLSPGAPYTFTLDDQHGTQKTFTGRALPAALPAEGACFAVASCFYNGFRMATKLRSALASVRLVTAPLAELWVGDNMYLDVRDFDHVSPTHAFGQTLQRYLDYFESPDYAAARGQRPSFTAFDDHEFWNNYPEHQVWLLRSAGVNHAPYSEAALDCLSLFQSALNPAPVVPGGRAYRFDLDPVSFFTLDLRSQRKRKSSGSFRMMDPRELSAFSAWARGLTGPGVLIVGQPLWVEAGDFRDYNPPAFVNEYQTIWRELRDAPWDVLVVSGDVHHSRMLRIGVGEGRFVYELVTSPVSHIPTITSTLGFGNSQDKGKVLPPARAENVGFPTTAEYFFGTSSANSFALLRLIPKPGGQVAVGAGFVDYAGDRPVFPVSEPANLPRLGLQGKPCVSEELFTLRKR